MNRFDHITTVIFDMDETLYPEQKGETPVKGQAEKAIKVQAAYNNMSVEELTARVEKMRETHSDPMAAIRKVLPFPFEEWYDFLKTEGLYAGIQPCRDVPALLQKIKKRKILFTNGGNGHVTHVFEQCGLKKDWFEHIITNQTHNVLPKPSLESYEAVLALIDQPAAQCAFVEDKPTNLEPAKKLGMTTIHVNTPQTHAPYVDYYYADISSLLKELVQE